MQIDGNADSPDVWDGLWRLIERAPSLEGLRAQRLHLLAARHFLEIGRPVGSDLQFEELHAIGRAIETKKMLETARQAYAGRFLLFKGPEVAARYPDPALRPSTDVDLLAENPEEAQRSLIAAGFVPVGDFPDNYYDGLHHLRPLALPGSAAPHIEIHRRLNWVRWSDPPDLAQLLGRAIPSASQAGMLTLPPDLHLVSLVAHAWGDVPLRRVLDFVDLLVMSSGTDYTAVAGLAEQYGLMRAWRTSIAVANALLLGGSEPLPLRTWARDLKVPRDRIVLETHLRRWLSPWWAHKPSVALLMTVNALVEDVTPVPGETMRNKLFRVRQAVTHPNRPSQEHRAILGPSGVRPRHKRR